MNENMYRLFYEIQKKHWWFVSKKKIVSDFVENILNTREKKENKILDVGCGSGLMLEKLSEYGTVYGMDFSDEAIKFSSEIYPGEIRKGSLPNAVPFEDAFFDLIVALDVIEHVDEDVLALKTIKTKLKTGGKAIITVPAYMFLWSKFDEINEHKRRYTVPDLKNKLEISGLKIRKISYYNTFLFPVVYLVRNINKLLKRNAENEVAMPSRNINNLLKKIFSFESGILNKMNMPFGVSIIAIVEKV